MTGLPFGAIFLDLRREKQGVRVFAGVKKLVVLFMMSGCPLLFGQESIHSSTLTFGVGGTPASEYVNDPSLQNGGPAFRGNYEYRLLRYLAVEGGADFLLPATQEYDVFTVATLGPDGAFSFNSPGNPFLISTSKIGFSRVAFLTYGLKGILPLARQRVELFAGLGGAYEWNSEFSFLNTSLAQASVGGRLAVDKGRHFWLGTTLRGIATFGAGRQYWAPLTFDFGVRLGR